MKNSLKILLISIFIFSIPLISYGADALYRLMHNDHDALVIAEITEIDDDHISFRVEKSIISVNDLNQSSKKKQIEIEEFTIRKKDFIISLFDTTDNDDSINSGDGFLISLNKEGYKKFKVAWGAYRVSSLNYETLDIVYPNDSPEWKVIDAAAIKYFVNSDGRETEFSFDGSTNTVKCGDKIIYNGSDIELDESNSYKEKLYNQEASKATVTSNDKVEETHKSSMSEGILSFLVAGFAILIVLLKAKKK